MQDMQYCYNLCDMTMNFQNLSVMARSIVLSVWVAAFCSLTAANFACAEEEDFKKTVEEFNVIKTSTGMAPSLNDYIRLVIDDRGKNLSACEQIDLWEILKEMQNPMITREELLALLESKYRAIDSFESVYTLKQEVKDSSCGHRDETVKYRFAKKGSQFLVERDRIEGEPKNHILISSTKDRYIMLNIPSEDDEHGLVNASLGGPSGERGEGFEPWSPLSQSGLCDTSFYNFPHEYYDLVLFLNEVKNFIIFEKTEMVNDCECLVIASLSCRLMLDIDKDFSLVQICGSSCVPRETPDDPVLERVFLSSQSTLYGLTSYGNSIWFPKKSVTEYFTADSEAPYMTDTVDYEKIEVNHHLSDSYFSGVIPDGALVADSIRDMVYVWGDRASIGSLIKKTVKTKRQTIFRNLSVVFGLCFLACWGFIEWRKRRLLKENTE